jgi:uncharacterized phage infection (PIP) family protein YhgE
LTNSSSLDRDDSISEILELETIPAAPIQPSDIPSQSSRQVTDAVTLPVADKSDRQRTVPTILRSTEIDSTGEIVNVTAELDLLIKTLDRANPHPPQLNRPLDEEYRERERRQQESHSISETLAEIAATELNTDTLLYRELSNIHQQIAIARQELQTLHQRNQSQVEAIDAHAERINRLKVRTQQLAYYTKNRVGKVQELIGTVDAIRTEIVTGLEKFGGYREIRSLLVELETSRAALVLADDRLSTGQETFYESLQAIEQRVTSHSNDSVDRLRRYQESIESLSQTISTDRLQMAEMNVDLSLKYAQIEEQSDRITQMHAQVTEKSQLIHRRVAEIDRGFTELAESVRLEKDQFYELTAETIDRTTAIRSQFSNIDREFSLDREAIAALQSELATLRESVDRANERQLDYFDVQFYELLADWNELSGNRQERSSDRRKILTWLWILTVAIGLTLAFSIYILLHLKK